MRVENIEVTLKIPFREVDCNGFEYSESAIKEACKKVISVPIMFLDKNEFSIIGNAHNIEYDEENKCVIVKGLIKSGGTCEIIDFYGEETNSMKITSVGINKYE